MGHGQRLKERLDADLEFSALQNVRQLTVELTELSKKGIFQSQLEMDYGQIICDILDEFNDAFRFADNQESVNKLKFSIVPIITELSEIEEANILLSRLNTQSQYIARHCIAVGILAKFIGEKLGMKKRMLQELTLAATMHDIRKFGRIIAVADVFHTLVSQRTCNKLDTLERISEELSDDRYDTRVVNIVVENLT